MTGLFSSPFEGLCKGSADGGPNDHRGPGGPNDHHDGPDGGMPGTR